MMRDNGEILSEKLEWGSKVKRNLLFIVILSILLLVGCSKGKIVLMNFDSNNEILEELGFSKDLKIMYTRNMYYLIFKL